MDTTILSLLSTLRVLIEQSPDFLLVKEYERRLDDPLVAPRLVALQTLVEEYNQSVERGNEDPALRKRLSQYRLELDRDEVIGGYQEAFNRINSLLQKVTNIILEGIKC